jgi:hypothetical protein
MKYLVLILFPVRFVLILFYHFCLYSNQNQNVWVTPIPGVGYYLLDYKLAFAIAFTFPIPWFCSFTSGNSNSLLFLAIANSELSAAFQTSYLQPC